jgi:hypothetical protein
MQSTEVSRHVMGRLDGSYGRETANSAAVADVAATSALHLSGMQAALQAAVEAQGQRCASVTAALDSFLQKNASDVALLKVNLHTTMASVSNTPCSRSTQQPAVR